MKTNTSSPKGDYRMKGLAPFAVIALVVLWVFAPEWLTPLPVFVLKASLGVSAWYWVCRIWVSHTRTHELGVEQRHTRENFDRIAVALIIAMAWLGV